jgi:RNA polymerase sigma factor (sigma-70 family)
MNKKQAFEYLASKYEQVAEFVYQIEAKYFQKKGCYHKDITQDLYLKIYAELEKVEEKPGAIGKFVDRFYNGKTFNLYRVVKNMYIDLLRKEKKYVPFDETTLTKNERERLIEKAEELNIKEVKSIEDKVDDYVDTFFWFDRDLFNLYRYEFKTHQSNMSKQTKLSISTIYRTVKRCKIKINQKLKEDYYEK